MNYFPLDVDIFSDTDIRILLSQYGCDAVTLYLYLLCMIYRSGYYIPLCNDTRKLVYCDLDIDVDKTDAMLDAFAARGLFDADLMRNGILTSAGIQRRYQEMVAERVRKRGEAVTVESTTWLLSPEFTNSNILVIENDEKSKLFLEKPPVIPGKTPVFPGKTPQSKVKENKNKNKIKLKEKGKEENPLPQLTPPQKARGSYKNVILTDATYAEFAAAFPDAEARIEHLSRYMHETGKQYADHASVLWSWAKEDRKKQEEVARREIPEGGGSFDTKDFFEAALRKSGCL